MEKIFEQYGGVIVTVIAIVALIVIVKFLVFGASGTISNPQGLLANQFNSVVTTLSDKFGSFLNNVNFGSGTPTP